MKPFNMITRCLRSAVSFAFLFVALQAFDLSCAVDRAAHWLSGTDSEGNKSSGNEKFPEAVYGAATVKRFHKAVAEGNFRDVEAIMSVASSWPAVRRKAFFNSIVDDTTVLEETIGKDSKTRPREQDYQKIVELLIQQPEIDLNKTGKEKGPPLLVLALKYRRLGIANILFTKCGDKALNNLSYKSDTGNTILHLIAKEGYADVVTWLLDKNLIDINFINIENKAGETALYLASEAAKTDIVTLLLKQEGINLKAPGYANLLCWAADQGYGGIVRLILKDKPEYLNMPGKDGNTPLHLAAQKGRKDAVNALLEVPDIDVNVQNNDKNTPLHIAARQDNTAVAVQLVKHKDIDPDLQNSDGYTPGRLAVIEGHTATPTDSGSGIVALILLASRIKTLRQVLQKPGLEEKEKVNIETKLKDIFENIEREYRA